MILIGYSGHGLVAAGILNKMQRPVTAYCDNQEKSNNPLGIKYLGKESDFHVLDIIYTNEFFIAIGDNNVRKKVAEQLAEFAKYPTTIIHPSAIYYNSVEISQKGVMIGAGVVVNPFSKINDGVILNTSSVIEHECFIDSFAHVGPGAILCGNVSIGEGSFVGAGSVIRQNIKIGKNVIIGAGSVIVKDVKDGEVVLGNPGKRLIKNK